MQDLDTLIEEHKDKLYKLCMYLEKNRYNAEELFQDTWVKAIEKHLFYDRTQPFYPWLSYIAVNLYRDKLRRLKREVKYILWQGEKEIQMADEGVDLLREVIKKDEWQLAKESLQSLDDKYKLPIILVLVEGLSYKEAGKILDIPEKTIKSRIYDGRVKIKKMVEKEEIDCEWRKRK